jgi:hypothetical protein
MIGPQDAASGFWSGGRRPAAWVARRALRAGTTPATRTPPGRREPGKRRGRRVVRSRQDALTQGHGCLGRSPPPSPCYAPGRAGQGRGGRGPCAGRPRVRAGAARGGAGCPARRPDAAGREARPTDGDRGR